MKSREKVLRAVLLGLGTITTAAVGRKVLQGADEMFRQQVIEEFKQHMDYEALKATGELDTVNVRIAGNWMQREVATEFLSAKGTNWFELFSKEALPYQAYKVEERFSALEGLYVQRIYFSPHGENILKRVYRNARTEEAVVGKANLINPAKFHPGANINTTP